ncbi:hypothetical protein D3C80_1954930 [compost metagenome]
MDSRRLHIRGIICNLGSGTGYPVNPKRHFFNCTVCFGNAGKLIVHMYGHVFHVVYYVICFDGCGL